MTQRIVLPQPDPLLCDFCGTPEPAWEYPTQNFGYAIVPNRGSDGAWLACIACHFHIEGDKWAELEKRCIYLLAKKNGWSLESTTEIAQAVLPSAWAQFRGARTGPAREFRR